jgi:hypothetical protein
LLKDVAAIERRSPVLIVWYRARVSPGSVGGVEGVKETSGDADYVVVRVSGIRLRGVTVCAWYGIAPGVNS